MLIFEGDIDAAARVDGLPQWAEDHPLVMLNASAPPDRKRLTLAHGLGNIVFHSQFTDGDLERQANLSAAKIQMPQAEIKPILRSRLTFRGAKGLCPRSQQRLLCVPRDVQE